jgi:uncharacterized protein (DUF1330 family)
MSDEDAPAPHIQPTRDAIRALATSAAAGPVTMLNLLRFRARADYASAPELAPPGPISGAEAYRRYLQAAGPILAGSRELVLTGTSSAFLIGPADERWDAVLVARYRSVEDFLAFTQKPEYLAIVGHRTAALADSRLLPIRERALDRP